MSSPFNSAEEENKVMGGFMKKNLFMWRYDFGRLIYINDKDKHIVTKEQWNIYHGKENEPTDRVLDAIYEIVFNKSI